MKHALVLIIKTKKNYYYFMFRKQLCRISSNKIINKKKTIQDKILCIRLEILFKKNSIDLKILYIFNCFQRFFFYFIYSLKCKYSAS